MTDGRDHEQGDAGQVPGDEAEPGTPGTGENVCPKCGGTGQIEGGAACPDCAGTGKIVEGVGGG